MTLNWTARRTIGIMGPGQRFYTAEHDDAKLTVERSGEGWINTITDNREGGSPGFSSWRETLPEAKAASEGLLEKLNAERRRIAERYPPGTRRPSWEERTAELQDILAGDLEIPPK